MTTYDIAVIGGGPAGLTAGLYGARGLAKTIIFERAMPGGQITTTDWVENYPAFPEGISGAELGALMHKQAEEHGAEIGMFVDITRITRNDEGLFRLESDGDDHLARTVILATGAIPKKLGVPGEAEYTGRGVSWCATCDGAFYRDKVVAVVGGGDAAVEEALFLTKFATKVYLVHRRDEFRATKVIVERAAAHEQVEFVLSRTVKSIEGNGSKVTGVVLASTAGEGDLALDVDGVFEFVGVDPESGLVNGLAELTAGGYVVANEDGTTNVEGLFAAGDVTNGSLKQVVTAAGKGATAAFAALHYLENHHA